MYAHVAKDRNPVIELQALIDRLIVHWNGDHERVSRLLDRLHVPTEQACEMIQFYLSEPAEVSDERATIDTWFEDLDRAFAEAEAALEALPKPAPRSPETTTRPETAVDVTFNDMGTRATVPASGGSHDYKVGLTAQGVAYACDCADHHFRKRACKHMRAAEAARWVCEHTTEPKRACSALLTVQPAN